MVFKLAASAIFRGINNPISTGKAFLRGLGAPTEERRNGVLNQQIADENSDPLILVHGYMDNGNTPWWGVLEDYLVNAGWPREKIYTVTVGQIPGTTVGCPTESALKVYQTIKSATKEHGQNCSIIAHSMGGIASRWAIEQLDGNKYVNSLVTLGTPHQSTYLAYVGIMTGGGKAMIPDSDILTTLNTDESIQSNVEYTALWSQVDPLLVPKTTGKIPEDIAGDNVENIMCGNQSHLELVHDPLVFRIIAPRLAKSDS